MDPLLLLLCRLGRRLHRMKRQACCLPLYCAAQLGVAWEVNLLATFTNQATLSYAGGTVQSNVVSGEILEQVSMVKTAVSTGYFPGEKVTYAVSLINEGDTAVSGVAVTDDLGAYVQDDQTLYPLSYVAGSLVYLVNGAPEAAPAVEAGAPLTITGVGVPAGGSAVLIYEAEVTEYAPLGADAAIHNNVTAAGPCIPEPLSAAASLPMEARARLAIAKAVSPEVVSGCTEVSYTFTLTNTGEAADAAAAVVVSDTFDPVLSDLTVTMNGQRMAESAYTYDEATGVFATVAGQITVPAASYAQGTDGAWIITPGEIVLTVSGMM